jgi:hypothetical protein
LFRLFRTNEVPINYPPMIFSSSIPAPGIAFLNHTSVAIIGSSRTSAFRIRVHFEDEDDDPLAVSWTNLQTYQPITNDISVTRIVGAYDVFYEASVALDASMFPPGRYSVSVSISDGTSTVTQTYSDFEVISFEMAFEEFTAALDSLRSDRAGRRAVLFWENYQRARDKGHDKLAEKRWMHFQRQLSRVTSLSEKERGKLSSAAEQVKALLQSQ